VIPDEVPLNWLLRGSCLRAIEQLRFPKSFFLAKAGKRDAASAKNPSKAPDFLKPILMGIRCRRPILGSSESSVSQRLRAARTIP
jgi:hypothetical protein